MKKATVRLAAALLLILALIALYAPGFLVTGDIPRQVDAVVLFVGPGRVARLDEAKQLIKEGNARYLIIPSSGELLPVVTASRLVWTAADKQPQGDSFPGKRIVAGYRKYFENTHIEALEAKRMMDGLNLRSAIFVSSPYHMRRIRLIAAMVFDKQQYGVFCNPVRRQVQFTSVDWLDGERREFIVSEYMKIAWFLAYSAFDR